MDKIIGTAFVIIGCAFAGFAALNIVSDIQIIEVFCGMQLAGIGIIVLK